MPAPEPLVRRLRDADAAAVVELVRTCWSEYEGCIYDEDEMRHLRRPASHYAALGGDAWVAVRGERLLGSVACRPAAVPDVLELQLLYVWPEARRQGMASMLVGRVEGEARRRRATRVELWSDSRFTAAHRMYEVLGYRRQPGARHLDDVSATVEWPFAKELPGS